MPKLPDSAPSVPARPSMLAVARRSLVVALAATVALGSVTACGGPSGNDRWVVTENTTVEIDWDAINQAYKDAEGPEDFETEGQRDLRRRRDHQRVGPDLDDKSQVVTGFFDKNEDGKVDEGEQVFTIQRDIVGPDKAQYPSPATAPYGPLPLADVGHRLRHDDGHALEHVHARLPPDVHHPVHHQPRPPRPPSPSRAAATAPPNPPKASGSGRSYGSKGGASAAPAAPAAAAAALRRRSLRRLAPASIAPQGRRVWPPVVRAMPVTALADLPFVERDPWPLLGLDPRAATPSRPRPRGVRLLSPPRASASRTPAAASSPSSARSCSRCTAATTPTRLQDDIELEFVLRDGDASTAPSRSCPSSCAAALGRPGRQPDAGGGGARAVQPAGDRPPAPRRSSATCRSTTATAT
jgi:hypothetical protein